MTDFVTSRQRFDKLKCCILIPTYNNDKTLEQVIQNVLNYSSNVIVVNDGSTDRTHEILDKFKDLRVINIPKNTGKGYALRLGFHYALKQGYHYTITIDSDGQHYADDLLKFLDKIEEEPDSLIIGARNMDHSNVPGTSSFGHKFSIFWFRVETGIKLEDVQSGYRLYPLEKIEGMRFFGKKYEFEVEVLVKLAWKEVNITSVPVKVHYAPKGERVSHFRKFRDFTRVSIANTFLVFIALLWINPFRFIKAFRKQSIKKFIQQYVFNSEDSNTKITISVTLGVFVGVLPIWGFQMLVAFGVAYLLKLNKFVTIAASNISIPPMLPFIVLLSYITGGLITGSSNHVVNYSSRMSLGWIKANLIQYLVGSIIFGILLALVLGTITYFLLRIFRKQKVAKAEVNDKDSHSF
jgi:glycosyltransferase involved in cell wall biosynthesis